MNPNIYNFLVYMNMPLTDEEINLIYRANNVNYERCYLYYDFLNSFFTLIKETYLGEEYINGDHEKNHFNWCLNKVTEDFKKENIIIETTGSHLDYFKDFYDELFYSQENENIKDTIDKFFKDIFDMDKEFTQSDLDMVLTIYKSLDKNMTLNIY